MAHAWLLAGFGAPGKWQLRKGRTTCLRGQARERPGREAASLGWKGWSADAAAREAERVGPGDTMAPQNLSTFCLLLLYLIGAVIAG